MRHGLRPMDSTIFKARGGRRMLGLVRRLDAPDNEHEVANERVAQKRPSQSFWPRVMRGRPRGLQRSVDRGSRRRGIEPRNTRIRTADAVKRGGRQQPADRKGERCGKAAWSKTLCMRGSFMERNWEIPTLCGERWRAAARREDRKIGAGDGRRWEVGASHSIAEAVERTGYLRSRSVG